MANTTSNDVDVSATVQGDIQPAAVKQEKNQAKPSKKRFAYLRLLVAADPTKIDYLLLITGTIAAIGAGIPFPLLGIIFGQLVDTLNDATCNSTTQDDADSSSEYQQAVNTKVLQVVYITIASFVLIYIYVLSWSLMGERLVQRLRDQYFRSLLRQEASFFDNLPAGEVSSRLNGDISIIQAGTSEKVGICISSASFFITAYIVAFMKDSKMAAMLMSLVPAFLIMSLVGSKYINKYSGQISDHIASASSIASEGLSNISVVHAFGANARLEGKFAADLMKAQKQGIKKAIATATQTGLLYFIAYAGNALAFWQGARTIADSVGLTGTATTVGVTYTIIFILVDASLILSQVAPFLQNLSSAAAAFEKLEVDMNHFSTLDGTSEMEGNTLETVSGNIEFRNVTFKYPSRPDQSVVQDLSIICRPGKHTAIVGLSGSGKSTVAALIARLYDPIEGSVFLDGQDIKELNLRQLRSFISLVQQEPSLFDRSILENIALGLVSSPASKHAHLKAVLLGSHLSELAACVRGGQDIAKAAESLGPLAVEIVDMVRRAAEIADALSFIDRLEHGLATIVGSTGNLMSGGQKQRVALARALIKDPAILILDEATSNLDSSSQERIQAAVEKMASGRTLVSIAHRLSTVKNADNIIVMRHGKVMEQGSHSQLIAQQGVYHGMVNLQSLDPEPEPEEGTKIRMSDSFEDISMEKPSLISQQSGVDGGAEDKDSSLSIDSLHALDFENENDEAPSKKSTWSILKSISPLFRRYLLVLLLAFFTSTIVGASYSAEAIIFGDTVENLSPCKTPESIRSSGNLFGLLFFILAIVEFFANMISWGAFGYTSERILYVVRVLSFRSLFEQDLQWHQSKSRSPALLLSFITKDGNALGNLTGSVIGTIFSIAVNLLVAIILSHIIAWKIALVCLVTVPVLLGASIMQLRVLTRFEERHEQAFARSTGITVEAVNSIKTVASLSLEHEVLITYRRSLEKPRKEIIRASAYANLWLAIAHSIGNLVYALAYWWGAKQIIAGTYTQSQFFTVLLALLVSAQLWGQMFLLAPDLSKARSAVIRILNLIHIGSTSISSFKAESPDRKQSIENDPEATANPLEKSPITKQGGMAIEFKEIKFAYPARPNIEVLHSLSLSIKPGQFCALVGPSGAGKSTIISLIERFYTPTSGSISLDGLDSSKRNVNFRDEIALVPQDSVLFEGSIRFNVSLGARPDHVASDEEIEVACRLANIHDTIISLPQGYDTNCGPNGNQLSGGQKQRLSIARALVRKPRLLLLDESTSALDAESEKLLQDGLEKASKGITVIAIAHRLQTIRKADVIFVIEEGRCVDSGTHEELAIRSESYKVNTLHQILHTEAKS